MNITRGLRLCLNGKALQTTVYREYTNKNLLKLYERGMYDDLFPQNSSKEFTDLLNKGKQCVYAGFDPTADSLHLGNLLILMNLLHWQRSGHEAIALIGGATGLLGDPSHRKEERIEMDIESVQANVSAIQNNIETVFTNHQKYFWNYDNIKPIKIVNNFDWYKDINVLEFIHSVGKYFRVGTMIGRKCVQERLNSPNGMNFAELSYQLFQAYDWLHLYKNYNCRFQIGGTDQLGNMVSGYDLITKSSNTDVYGLTIPLITSEGGKKFGKSVSNAIWLSAKKSSSFKLYQFMIRINDTDVEKFLHLFTFYPIPQIKQIMETHIKNPEKRKAQTKLAEQVTLLVHGEEGLKNAQRISSVLYEKNIESISSLKFDEVTEIFDGAKITDVMPTEGMTVLDLAKKTKCFTKDTDALQAIPAGGFHINYHKITNINEVITQGIHIMPNNISLIRVGKKNFHIVRWL